MPVSEIQAAQLPEAVTSLVAQQRSHYPTLKALLIPVLMECQKHFGYISPEVAQAVGALLSLPYGEVQSCVSFYTMLWTRPTGRYLLGVCRTLNCELDGAQELIHHYEHKYHTGPMDLTPDGNFTMYEVECLCDCHNAPSVQVIKAGADFRVWWLNNLTTEVWDTVLSEAATQGDSAFAERLVRVVDKHNPPDDRRWCWLVTTVCQYPVWIEAQDGECIPHDGYGKLDGLKQSNPKLWNELQTALR